jgi:hypothetical protein
MAARRQIDDAQPAVPEPNAGQHGRACVIGATANHHVTHAVDGRRIDRFTAKINNSTDATHQEISLLFFDNFY